jgi:hypothetical protein
MPTISYVPHPKGIDNIWVRSADVYLYLLRHKDERKRLQKKAEHKFGDGVGTVIHHRCIPFGLLQIYTGLPDQALVLLLTCLLHFEGINGRAPTAPLVRTIQSMKSQNRTHKGLPKHDESSYEFDQGWAP